MLFRSWCYGNCRLSAGPVCQLCPLTPPNGLRTEIEGIHSIAQSTVNLEVSNNTYWLVIVFNYLNVSEPGATQIMTVAGKNQKMCSASLVPLRSNMGPTGSFRLTLFRHSGSYCRCRRAESEVPAVRDHQLSHREMS